MRVSFSFSGRRVGVFQDISGNLIIYKMVDLVGLLFSPGLSLA